jgi:hypothetical protein
MLLPVTKEFLSDFFCVYRQFFRLVFTVLTVFLSIFSIKAKPPVITVAQSKSLVGWSPPVSHKQMEKKTLLSVWYPQSKGISMNLRMKCWNSAFNAQGSRVIIVVATKIYVAAMKALRKKRKDRMKLRLLPNLLEKLVWVPIILLLWNCHSQLHVWCPIKSKLYYSCPLITRL